MTKKIESSLDPVLPLPANTSIPPVKQGEGDAILHDTRLMVIELPYRAFYSLWEMAERRAEKDYAKYATRRDGTEAYAELLVESVHAFRSSFRKEIIPILSEEEAQRIREKESKKAKKTRQKDVQKSAVDPKERPKRFCPACSSENLKLTKKDGKKLFRCLDCGQRGPRVLTRGSGSPPESRSKPLKGVASPNGTSKPESASQRPRKRPKQDSKRG